MGCLNIFELIVKKKNEGGRGVQRYSLWAKGLIKIFDLAMCELILILICFLTANCKIIQLIPYYVWLIEVPKYVITRCQDDTRSKTISGLIPDV